MPGENKQGPTLVEYALILIMIIVIIIAVGVLMCPL